MVLTSTVQEFPKTVKLRYSSATPPYAVAPKHLRRAGHCKEKSDLSFKHNTIGGLITGLWVAVLLRNSREHMQSYGADALGQEHYRGRTRPRESFERPNPVEAHEENTPWPPFGQCDRRLCYVLYMSLICRIPDGALPKNPKSVRRVFRSWSNRLPNGSYFTNFKK